MRIGEVAKQAGISTATLRYYESIGLLPAPRRLNGRRDYDTGVFEQLSFIHAVQRVGFTLREIRGLLQQQHSNGPLSVQLRLLIEQKMTEVEAKLSHYQAAHDRLAQSLTCVCVDLGDCVLLGDE